MSQSKVASRKDLRFIRREVLRMTQEELGRLWGRNTATINRWENGVEEIPLIVQHLIHKIKLEGEKEECAA